jgi:uncharacterized repeat protein (TIGR03803 family)
MANKKSLILSPALFALLFVLLTTAAPAFAASKEKVLYSFCSAPGCADGAHPLAGPISDSSGNLYGTTYDGGASGSACNGSSCGTVFELTRGANGKWKHEVLHSFHHDGKDGYWPKGGLVFDAVGHLYGTTTTGGTYGCGTVFRLMPGTNRKWKENVLHSFNCNGSDGSDPWAGLILDAAGNLYGTTSSDGPSCQAGSCGTVFEVTPHANGHWTERVLHYFDYNGGDPEVSLPLYAAGRWYGTTFLGGTHGDGSIFELTPSNGRWSQKLLHSFNDSDGALLCSGVIFDVAHNLYGTTLAGGDLQCGNDTGCGTVFQITPAAKGRWTEKVLHSFHTTDGASPYAGLILDAGNLYGVTEAGGANNAGCSFKGCSTVFKLTPGTDGQWVETVLHSFAGNGTDGYEPTGAVVSDTAGHLYGTTFKGGSHDSGTVFEIAH